MNPFSCSVCTDPEDQENKFFICEICGVCIHALCYGIDTDVDSSEKWLCSPCNVGISQPSCVLCLQTSGAMKKTSNGEWVHVICALFTEGAFFEDENDMEPVNLSGISESKQKQTCAYCLKAVGFCSLCSKSKCTERIHVTCAQKNKCTIEVVKEEDNSIDFRAYCSKHKPSKSKRRVSSKFVRKVVAKKGTKANKKKYSHSANQNANWILSKQENVLKDTQNLNNMNGKRPTEQSNSDQSNAAIKIAKLQSQITESCNDKENASRHKTKKHRKEKQVAKNQSNEKSSEVVNASKPSTPNTAANILKRIEDKMNNAQNQMNANEITPVKLHQTSTPKISNVAFKKKNQTETIEGIFCDVYIFILSII